MRGTSTRGGRVRLGVIAALGAFGALSLAAVSAIAAEPAQASAAHAGMAQASAARAGIAEAALSTASWSPAWSSDFSGSALPSGCGTYSGTYGTSGNAWSPSEVSISGGLLRIDLEHRSTDGRAWTAGGVGCWGVPQTYGRYEIRAKIPPGRGIDSYFALWPTQGSEGRWTGLEMLAPGVQTGYLTNGWGSGSSGATVPGQYADAFHTYQLDWTPAGISLTKDGAVIYQSPHSYTQSRFLALVVSNGDSLTGVPDASTPLPAQFQIDYVRVWRYAGEAANRGMIRQPTGPNAAAAGSGPAAPNSGTSGGTAQPTALASAGTGSSAQALAALAAGSATEGPGSAGDQGPLEMASDSAGASGGALPWVIAVLLAGVAYGVFRSYVRSPQRHAGRRGATN